jgi:DNA-binding NtrC family response regulator
MLRHVEGLMARNEARARRSIFSNRAVRLESRQQREIALAARSDACILITGGVKQARELAYQMHLASGWRHGAFRVIECSSGDPDLEIQLLEAIFPTDYHPASGVLQLRLVQAGTVLLQEVNNLPLDTQRRLAGRLSDLCAAPAIGRSRRRLMASTSEPLIDRVFRGTFDDSLYYRLNVMQFFVSNAG